MFKIKNQTLKQPAKLRNHFVTNFGTLLKWRKTQIFEEEFFFPKFEKNQIFDDIS
jgi:starvation-inducible outer membrane lipoprotein